MSTTPAPQPSDDNQAPDIQMPQTPAPSNLGQAVSQMPRYDNSQEKQVAQDNDIPYAPGSRLVSILGAIAKVSSDAFAGITPHGRPSFINGMAEGARAGQAADAAQQAIKFKTFDDQVRAASLHNQDIELQMHSQAQQDAHQAAQDAQHDWDEAHGIQYDEIPNSGQAVTDHLTAQTQTNGAASVPAGTHLSADGKTILIPKPTSETQAAQLQKYNTFAAAYNLPALPQGAQFVPQKLGRRPFAAPLEEARRRGLSKGLVG